MNYSKEKIWTENLCYLKLWKQSSVLSIYTLIYKAFKTVNGPTFADNFIKPKLPALWFFDFYIVKNGYYLLQTCIKCVLQSMNVRHVFLILINVIIRLILTIECWSFSNHDKLVPFKSTKKCKRYVQFDPKSLTKVWNVLDSVKYRLYIVIKEIVKRLAAISCINSKLPEADL